MRNYILRPIATLILCLFAIGVQAQSSQDVLPDTPENRARVEAAYEQYLDINKKHGHFIEVNGIRVHYLEWGDDRGVPLIWSHGYSSTAFELINVAEQLVDVGYHVYSISYRGHGQTQVEDYNFSLAHIADDIAAMMDRLGIEKAVIGGLSLGGGVTTTFYENYPERALGLILEDGGADAVQIRTELMYEQFKAMAGENSPPQTPVFTDRFAGVRFMANVFVPGWGGEFPKLSMVALHAFIVEKEDGSFGMHHDDAKLFASFTEAAINPSLNHKLPLLHQSWRRVHPQITYRNLAVPMAIIDPTGDVFDATASFEQLRDLAPDLIALIEYPDTPHAAHPMRPEWFVRDLETLLRKVQ